MHREMGQPSLVESLLPEKLGQNQRLERIHQAVDWVRIGTLAAQVYDAPEGRPSYPPLLMVKVLLLEQWYNLSDPQMEEALGDRISFRRFVGLGLQEDAPDHSTISRFRTALAERGLAEELFLELGRQLEERGLMLKQGTLMDATVVAPRCASRRRRRAGVPKAPKTPMRTGPTPTGERAPTSATGSMRACTQGRGWCAGRFSPRPKSTKARRPMHW